MLKETMFNGKNLWLVKPNDCNRGRGVLIFDKLEDIKKVLHDTAKEINCPES